MKGFEKVLLVNPPISIGRNKMPYMPPVGLGYVAEALNRHNIQYDVIDMLQGYRFHDLAEKIEKDGFDLIGVSLWTFLYQETYRFIHQVKKKWPHIPIVVGGPHVSTLREQILEECEAIDYGVVLEGEETLIELCAGKPFNEITGLIYRAGSQVIYTGDRPFIRDLDSISFPRYKKFELHRYVTKNIGIISSRGCPYQCNYCPVATTMGRRFNARSAESVFEEILYWYYKGYRQFQVLDDNFTLKPERVYEICDLIEKKHLTRLQLSLPNGVRADRISFNLLKRMREIGFNEIAFGVEAGNNKILKYIKKNERIEVIEQAIREACDLNYRVILFFLIGSPGETWTDFMDSIHLALRYPVFSARFYNVIPFPKTELFDFVKKNNYFILKPVDYLNNVNHFTNVPIFWTPEMSAEERKRAFDLGQATQSQVYRNFFIKQFKRHGPLGKILAYTLSSKIFLNVYWSTPMVRKLADFFRYRLFY